VEPVKDTVPVVAAEVEPAPDQQQAVLDSPVLLKFIL
jgi:hypothetical protein